jgi:NAD(P)-dependent dehydrogenase (short-subunit alcohol dehydrogenase family)
MADAGAAVVLSARSEEALGEVRDAIESLGGRALVVAGSVADGSLPIRAAETIERAWGRLDILVNCAGISPHFKPAELVEPAEMREVIETNLIGTFECCLAALPLLQIPGRASVINVSSIHATRAHERLVAYATSKGGVEMLTKSLAVEWAERGIRVNSIAPGYVETEMTAGLRDHPRWRESLLGRIPMGRFGTTSEIAECVLFLASDASSYLTGTTLVADGGWTAR